VPDLYNTRIHHFTIHKLGVISKGFFVPRLGAASGSILTRTPTYEWHSRTEIRNPPKPMSHHFCKAHIRILKHMLLKICCSSANCEYLLPQRILCTLAFLKSRYAPCLSSLDRPSGNPPFSPTHGQPFEPQRLCVQQVAEYSMNI